MTEIICKVNGLDCPNCSARVEKAVGKIKGVKSVGINFATGTMIVNVKDESVYGDIEATVKKVDPKFSVTKA